MKKIFLFIFLLIFTFPLFLNLQEVYAVEACTSISSSPQTLIAGEERFNLQARWDGANGESNFSPGDYFISIDGPAVNNYGTGSEGGSYQRKPAQYLVTGFVSTVEEFDLSNVLRWGDTGRLRAGELQVYVWATDQDGKIVRSAPLCSGSITVSGSQVGGGEGDCTITFLDKNFEPAESFRPNDIIRFQATGFTSGSDDTTHRAYIKQRGEDGQTFWSRCEDLTQKGLEDGISTSTTLPTGDYYLQVNTQCSPLYQTPLSNERKACGKNFYVNTEGGGIGRSGDPSANLIQARCDETGTAAETKKCDFINVGGVATVSTEIGGFINSLLGIILSLSGGIAVILIIIAGYRLMVSRGNPEQVQNARDQLTAAIVGLLFVIFSLVILQVIGKGILGIF